MLWIFLSDRFQREMSYPIPVVLVSFSEHADAGELSSYIHIYCNLCSNNHDSSYSRDSSVLSTITLQTPIISAQHLSITPWFPLHYLFCVNHETTQMHHSSFLWSEKHDYHNSINQSNHNTDEPTENQILHTPWKSKSTVSTSHHVDNTQTKSTPIRIRCAIFAAC